VGPHGTAPNTRRPGALGRGGPARFGARATAWRLSRDGDGAEQDGSTRLHPGTPRPSQGAPTPARSSDHATFFARVLWLRTREPVLRPLPIGLQPLESPADRFITHQAFRDALRRAHLRRQGQRPAPRGLALEARRLRQDRLEAFPCGGIQPGGDGLRTRRLLLHARHATRVKGLEDVTDGLDGPPHKRRKGLRGQPPGTREDDVGTPDTEGLRGASVGLQLPTLIISQGADKAWGFHGPSIPLEAQLQKNSCGDALGIPAVTIRSWYAVYHHPL